jgi:hypothetical protein
MRRDIAVRVTAEAILVRPQQTSEVKRPPAAYRVNIDTDADSRQLVGH